jgi:hypothetical protein
VTEIQICETTAQQNNFFDIGFYGNLEANFREDSGAEIIRVGSSFVASKMMGSKIVFFEVS